MDIKEAARAIQQATNGVLKLDMPKHYHYARHLNCWGYTALAAQWVDKPLWLDQQDMEYYLMQHTIAIEQEDAGIGDIAVYRATEYTDGYYEDELIHTAIVCDEDLTVLQKPGSNNLELAPCNNQYCEGDFAGAVSFRRVHTNLLLDFGESCGG